MADFRTDPAGARAIVARASVALLDFDGPVCRLFAHMDLRGILPTIPAALPWVTTPPGDIFDVLTLAGNDPRRRAEAHLYLRALELRSAPGATLTADVARVLRWLKKRHVAVGVVTNNSPDAVAAVALRLPELAGVPVFGRGPSLTPRLKPAVDLVDAALRHYRARPDQAFLLGDAARDLECAAASGVAGVGYATRLAKVGILAPLAPTVDRLADLISEELA